MITNKSEYKEYIDKDLEMTHIKDQSIIKRLIDPRRKFYRSLRLTEYYTNCRNDFVGKMICKYLWFRHKRLCNKTQWTIPPNTFGKGLCIVHIGTIVVSPDTRIGENCRIHVCVNLGDAIAKGKDGSPKMGNNVYIGPGVKAFGLIEIGDNTVIGANAVVNDSFPQGNCTIAGVPAKVVSRNTSEQYISAKGQ